MMGRLSGQEPLFFGFRLEDHVPADHLLRRVDAALDFSFIRRAPRWYGGRSLLLTTWLSSQHRARMPRGRGTRPTG